MPMSVSPFGAGLAILSLLEIQGHHVALNEF